MSSYYIDTEFNGLGGELISLALVREDGKSIYIIIRGKYRDLNLDPWVEKNVIPFIKEAPTYHISILEHAQKLVEEFLSGDLLPNFIADWPDDIKYLCEFFITGPGTMINIPRMTFEVRRVDSYPNDLKDAIQHVAFWDALALRYKLTKKSDYLF
jgi:hypothetical protein